MIVTHGFDVRFVTLVEKLRKTYGEKMFELEGIGEKDLDINAYSKSYFGGEGNTADKSIDANANVSDVSVVSWENESTKPIKKLNALYVLWKSCLEKHGIKRANKVIEHEIKGSIRIHDFYLLLRPYCYASSLGPLVEKGMPFYDKIKIGPIKHFMSYLNVSLQYLCYMSNQIAGACAFPDFFIYADYFLRKDHGEGWYEDKTVVESVKQQFQSWIFSVNFSWRSNQCVPETTEVLTPTGFKTHDQLAVGDDIYVWKDGRLEIEKVLRVNKSHFDGDLHSYVGRDLTQTVTPNHKVLRKKYNQQDYELVESSEIFGHKTPITIPVASKTYDAPDYDISDDMLKMVTMVLCDGYIDVEGVRIVLAKSPRREYGHKLMTGILDTLGMVYSTTRRIAASFKECGGCENEYELDVFTLNRESTRTILNYVETKSKLPEYFFKLSRRQALLVLETWASFDGHVEKGNYDKTKLQVDSEELAKDVQHLAVLAGYGSSVSSRKIGNNKTATMHVNLYQRQNKDCSDKTLVKYNGLVWCPTTDAGIVMFRENGKVFFSGNSPFTNLSIFDKHWLESLFGSHVNPDFSKPDFDNVTRIQKMFVDEYVRNHENNPFTFPVMTAAFLLDEDKRPKDMEFFDYICEVNTKNGLFNFYADNTTSSLSSCCRLRSDISESKKSDYTNSFGVGGINIGSHRVVTLNLPQIAYIAEDWVHFEKLLEHRISIAQDILDIHRELMKKLIKSGRLPLYSYGFMYLERQFSTLGFIGMNEALEIMGFDIMDPKGDVKARAILETFNTMNARRTKMDGHLRNVEQIPGESAAYNFARKDQLLFENAKYPLYSNQYIPLTRNTDIANRIVAQGRYDSSVGGGSILHLNVSETLTVDQMKKLVMFASAKGVMYFAVNYSFSQCQSCGKVYIGKLEKSPCHNAGISKYIRVVGYLTPVSTWAKERRTEFNQRQFYGAVEEYMEPPKVLTLSGHTTSTALSAREDDTLIADFD